MLHRLRGPLLLSALIAFAVGCTESTPAPGPAKRVRKPRDKKIEDFLPTNPLTQYVNPFVGTTRNGNVVPGALVPHGVVKLSPDTNQPPSSVKGYVYEDTRIQGFSHTHLSGPGGVGYGYSHVLLTAMRGEIATTEDGYSAAFSHDTEVAEPGYYAVDLADPDVRAEVTATRLCGTHRYTFRGGTPGHVLMDLFHSRGGFLTGKVEVVGNQEIRGEAHYDVDPLRSFLVDGMGGDAAKGSTAERPVYVYARFSRPFDSFGVWEKSTVHAGTRGAQEGPLGAYATFDSPDSAPVEVHVCLSAIDSAQAEQNFKREVEGRSFDTVREAARSEWNKLLNRLQVTGGTEEQKKIFYTALFHTFFQPVDFTESGRFWSGEDGKGSVLEAPDWSYYTDDWCMWDTFRTTHPLQVLMEPERRSDVVNSLVAAYQQGGWMPKCTWAATGYSRVMIANPFTPIIADAYLKGFDEYDVGVAWNGLWKAHTEEDLNSLLPGRCGEYNMGTPPEYREKGYISNECDGFQSSSMTLEHAFDDWSLSRMAEALGKTTERDLLRQRAQNYRNVFNAERGFMQGRHADGSWVEPFDPAVRRDGNNFTEATSWIYTWFVPHDVPGLMELLGGREAFVAKLDEYFTGGHHDPSNEPGFHVPYLYVHGGAPSKTQHRIREILSNNFSNAPGGLPGNDDAGAMSAYYVFGAIGLYPITPTGDTLLIGSPMFDSATLYLEPNFYEGKSFTIEAIGNGPEKPYIQSVTLNGSPLTRSWITHGEVVKGGKLVLQMGDQPSDWGSAPEDAPPSR